MTSARARPGADDPLDDALHLILQPLLERGLAFGAAGGHARFFLAAAIGEQGAALVDDRDLLGIEALHGGGDEVEDGADLALAEFARDAQHDGGGGLRRVAREQRALRHDEVDAGGADAVEPADRAGEFAFERAQPVDVLQEARRGQSVALVEDLPADAAAGR